MTDIYNITGIQAGIGPHGEIPVRKDVETWFNSKEQQDRDQVWLFAHALQDFQAMDYTLKESYYQIAGIHGLPLVHWDEQTTGLNDTGYCTHRSVLFALWHRPYLMLYEQRLYEIMKENINNSSFSQAVKDRLNQAADQWRLPFWDWAAKSDGSQVPTIAETPSLTVYKPDDGQPETLDQNPMYQFRLPNDQTFGDLGQYSLPDGDLPWSTCKATSKHATDSTGDDWINGSVDNAAVNTALVDNNQWIGKDFNTFTEAVYRLFSKDYVTQFPAFGTSRWDPEETLTEYTSLEHIHDNVHGDVGGIGHMGFIQAAAFDPIFWLHHCNIDRLCAIFQTLYPTLWFSEQDQASLPQTSLSGNLVLFNDDGTWSIPASSHVNTQTPLAPFHNSSLKNPAPNQYTFTSDNVRQPMDYKYTYPELQPWKWPNDEEYFASIRVALGTLYGSFADRAVKTRPRVQLVARAAAAQKQPIQSQPPAQVGSRVTHDDYIVNVLYDKFHYGGRPYKIDVFFGNNLVGYVYNFSTPPDLIGTGPQGCGNCRQQQLNGNLSTGQIPITQAVWDDPAVDEMNVDEVERYLAEHLRWTVTIIGQNQPVPQEDLHFIKISVARGLGTHYENDDILSEYHSYQLLPQVTDGKSGGLQSGE